MWVIRSNNTNEERDWKIQEEKTEVLGKVKQFLQNTYNYEQTKNGKGRQLHKWQISQ